MEPRIALLTRKLLHALRIKSQGEIFSSVDRYAIVSRAFDLRPWLNMFSSPNIVYPREENLQEELSWAVR